MTERGDSSMDVARPALCWPGPFNATSPAGGTQGPLYWSPRTVSPLTNTMLNDTLRNLECPSYWVHLPVQSTTIFSLLDKLALIRVWGFLATYYIKTDSHINKLIIKAFIYPHVPGFHISLSKTLQHERVNGRGKQI